MKALVAAGWVLGAGCARAEIYINELFFDPGGAGIDTRDEFIELRGPANMALDGYYLIFLEGEDNAAGTGAAGVIDNVFDLSGRSLGSNGYLVFRQAGNQETGVTASGPSRYTVVPGATDLINTQSGPGYGSGTTSSIGHTDVSGGGRIENGAATAMLIKKGTGAAPEAGDDLDVDNDGLDHPDGRDGWTIMDSVAYFEPFETVFGRAYAPVVYGKEELGSDVFFEGGIRQVNPGLEPGAQYVAIGWEIEYVARWGNSTGQTPADWHASNLTDDNGSGALPLGPGEPLDYRQSFTGDHGDLASGSTSEPPDQPDGVDEVLESTQNVPYGVRLLTNIGGPNYITGDYNDDGVVDAADYTVWRDDENNTATEFAHEPADANHDFVVDGADYGLWVANFGSPSSPSSPAVSAPEPGTALLAIASILGVAARSRR